MRYHFPISVDMYDFLTTGRFDYLEIGQTAEMILQMFPAPECVPKGLLVKKGWNIWLYGDIELHFSDDRLTQIRADFQPGTSLNGGRWLSLNPWFFRHADKLDLYSAIAKLVQHHIDFIKIDTPSALILRLQSGVELMFEKCNGQRLFAFCKQKPPYPNGRMKRRRFEPSGKSAKSVCFL